ncbi:MULTISPECIES: pyridoxal phosphate-dependent decarboxylase family protein [Streptomycetaceae]|uniref:Putative amino acid decarboxylase,pyridoxal-dependent protein n=1 Tax=Streptantibioticus cattleyicolor (strain ATCC 35852 / DSM 46488 / JCM 4925 / NBRC 14057 / NRRL 8057) TaxID=1003195 RepID=F8JTV0_STREN|nr:MULTISPECIES: pyridoxal-dependent decarboxylase [Streptomycetaceae]AEW98039.1 putative amino acid decarboxylase,pyridoxal-dependent protein [Streptantibioticus cattleyicolor NRRL 8057 = DSM 46488]MYS62434.1 aspartate aminotransferase family protein [Streptomyces sp. SID5468]CCB78356.1 Pyridoxal-dependent decarboxylase [Streptantibioticus cattleyicolor NRRL 8057 = DSM 46488]
MDATLAADLEGLPGLLERVRAQAVDFLDGLPERPVVVPSQPPGAVPLPERGMGLGRALEVYAERWEPLFSASAGPRYLGFVTGGATPAALAGDWLTSVADQNSTSALDAAGHHLEQATLEWLRELFGLSPAQQGTFVTGATMSNTVGLAIAREWLGASRGVSVAESGAGALGRVRVLSGSAHSSVAKALSMLGLGRSALVPVATLPDREAVDPAALEAALLEAREAGEACVVVANAGTVNTVDFDDLSALAALRDRYGCWLHVDAAFGAFGALSPDHEHLLRGLDAADSICVDLHKWLNVPYDAAVQFTRHRELQVRVFRNAAAYLGPLGESPDPVHLTPENSRRLRALPAWFTLLAYGREGYREIVTRCAANARALGDAVESTPELRLLAPVRFNVVCFTLATDPTPEALARLAADVGREVFVTPTVYAGVPALRAAFSNWRTTSRDVERVARALRERVAHDG